MIIDTATNQSPITIDISLVTMATNDEEQSFSWGDFPLLKHASVDIPPPSTASLTSDESFSSLEDLSRFEASTDVHALQDHAHTRSVSFSGVFIREHAVTMGDHDWCQDNLALTLDWAHAPSSTFIHMDDYEELRQHQGRLGRGELPRLDYEQRKELLKSIGGYTESDFAQKEPKQTLPMKRNLKRCRTVPAIALDEDDDLMSASTWFAKTPKA